MPKFRSLSLEGTMLRSDVGTTLRLRVWGLGLRGDFIKAKKCTSWVHGPLRQRIWVLSFEGFGVWDGFKFRV